MTCVRCRRPDALSIVDAPQLGPWCVPCLDVIARLRRPKKPATHDDEAPGCRCATPRLQPYPPLLLPSWFVARASRGTREIVLHACHGCGKIKAVRK